jgi:hypothetical protein
MSCGAKAHVTLSTIREVKIRTLTLVIPLLVGTVSAQTKPPRKSTASCGPLTDQTLRCPRFGFTYKVLFGWVDRTQEMNVDAQSSPDSNSNQDENAPANKDAHPTSSAGSETLLAVFERPPSAPGDTINSAVVIAAEPLANYHGIKTASDYFGAINELADQRGFKAVSDPYSFSVGTKQLVRGDFTKERGKLIMWQSSLAMIERGYIVSFTFIADAEGEANDLIANLNFARLTLPTPKEKK